MLIPCSLPRSVLASSDPRGGDDGDDASLAGIPMTLGFIGKFYVLAVVSRHTCGGWWVPWLSVRQSALLLPARGGEPVSSRPGTTGRDAPSNWQYSAGGIVVLISACWYWCWVYGHNR